MEIRLFQTTVKNQAQVQKIAPQINQVLKNKKWNFDLDDCDKVLRIEATQIPLQKLMQLMHKQHLQLTEIF